MASLMIVPAVFGFTVTDDATGSVVATFPTAREAAKFVQVSNVSKTYEALMNEAIADFKAWEADKANKKLRKVLEAVFPKQRK